MIDNKIFNVLKEKRLIKNPKAGTSIEILENANKLNLILSDNVSSTYALELWLSMSLRTNEELREFVKEFAPKKLNVEDITLSKFFEEFAKIRMHKDHSETQSLENNPIDAKYNAIIVSILNEDDKENTKGVIARRIYNPQGKLKVPTIKDYLAVAEEENATVLDNNPQLQESITDREDLLGNEKEGYDKIELENFKKQIYKIPNGFKILGVFNHYDKKLSKYGAKQFSRFRSVKTSATQRIINKLGGQGYLSSPTREKRVQYFISDVRTFGKGKDLTSRQLSFNGAALYALHDLNNRALRFKKNYIAGQIYTATGNKASKEDVRKIRELTCDLATRYMLFGIDLNNTTKNDPNVVFDYRMETRILDNLKRNFKGDETWVLPLAQNLASNMAIEFFKNAEISQDLIKENLSKAGALLPEFDRDFSNNHSYTGIMFNSEGTTYDPAMVNRKVKQPRISLSNLKDKLTFKKKDQEPIEENTATQNKQAEQEQQPVKDSAQKENAQKGNAQNQPQNAQAQKYQDLKNKNQLVVRMFGEDKVVKYYSFDEYCENFVNSILKPSAERNVENARANYQKFVEMGDEKSAKDKIVEIMGQDKMEEYYGNYRKYLIKMATKRAEKCNEYVDIVRKEIENNLITKINAEMVKSEKDFERIAKYEKIKESLASDKSLSTNELFKGNTDELIRVVFVAAKTKAEELAQKEITSRVDVSAIEGEKEAVDAMEKALEDFFGKDDSRRDFYIYIEHLIGTIYDKVELKTQEQTTQIEDAREAGDDGMAVILPDGTNVEKVDEPVTDMEGIAKKVQQWTKEIVDEDFKAADKNASSESEYFVRTVVTDQDGVKHIDFSGSYDRDESNSKMAIAGKEFRDELYEVMQNKSYNDLKNDLAYSPADMTVAEVTAHRIWSRQDYFINEELKEITVDEFNDFTRKIEGEFKKDISDIIFEGEEAYFAEKGIGATEEESFEEKMSRGRQRSNEITKIIKHQVYDILVSRQQYAESISKNKKLNLSSQKRSYMKDIGGKPLYLSLVNRYDLEHKRTKTLDGANKDALDNIQKEIDKLIKKCVNYMKDDPEYFTADAKELVASYIDTKDLSESIDRIVQKNTKQALVHLYEQGERIHHKKPRAQKSVEAENVTNVMDNEAERDL